MADLLGTSARATERPHPVKRAAPSPGAALSVFLASVSARPAFSEIKFGLAYWDISSRTAPGSGWRQWSSGGPSFTEIRFGLTYRDSRCSVGAGAWLASAGGR